MTTLFDWAAERDAAMNRVEVAAEKKTPEFAELAASFIVRHLAAHGATPGEELTEACKKAGIKPHDDRAFGPVYMRLARQNKIEKAGACIRKRGHGTAGGNVWKLKEGI